MPCRNLILILADQLSETISSLAASKPDEDLILMAEVRDLVVASVGRESTAG